MNFNGINESDKKILIKENFNDKNDVRHLLFCKTYVRYSSDTPVDTATTGGHRRVA